MRFWRFCKKNWFTLWFANKIACRYIKTNISDDIYEILPPQALIDNQWTLLACVWDGVERKIYFDGALISWDNFSGSFNDIGLSKTIGEYYNGNNKYEGLLDQLSMWTVALSQQEIQNYMNCAPIGNEAE